MNISIFLFVAAIFIVNLNASLQHRLYWLRPINPYVPYVQPQYLGSIGVSTSQIQQSYGPTGEYLPLPTPQYDANKGGPTQQVQQSYSPVGQFFPRPKPNYSATKGDPTQQVQQSPEIVCDEYEEERAAQSFKKLMLLGDKDLLISEHDGHHDEHCADAEKHLQSYLKHIKCTKGRFRKEISLLAKGFTEWVNNRCNSKEWHDKYILASQCYAKPQVEEEWHNCHDKNIASLGWILQNVPAKHQVDAMCCYIPLTKRCQHNKTDVYCGRNVADISADLIWQPWNERIETWCLGKFGCHEHPKFKKALSKIWTSPTPVKNRNNFYKFIYNVVQNTFSQCD